MHYRLCLERVHMKVLHNGDLPDFQRGQTVGARLTGASATKPAILLDISIAAVFRVMTVHHQLRGIVAENQV
jgi:hypothetical protein